MLPFPLSLLLKMPDSSNDSLFSAADNVLFLEEILERIFSFIEDRSIVSLVSTKWYNVDRRTRRKVTVTSCHAVSPSRFIRRFHAVQSVKIRGNVCTLLLHRMVMPECHVKHWISEISMNCMHLTSLYLRGMVVEDEEITTFARVRGPMRQVFRLVNCSGFSTAGLEAIATHCRSLKVFSVEGCDLDDDGGSWLHVLCQNMSSLEILNIAGTSKKNVQKDDLAILATRCTSLMSLNVNGLDLKEMSDVLRRTTALRELGGVSVNGQLSKEISLPTMLTSLVSLFYKGEGYSDGIINSIIQPIAATLRKIDLQYACLSVSGHCQALDHCSNLEALRVFSSITDEGLDVVARQCKNLQSLWIECGFVQSFVTQRGLISVATNCHLLQRIVVQIPDINNAALKTIASSCPDLKDFRLLFLDKKDVLLDDPLLLDEGVKDLIQGCQNIHHFELYLARGLLTDKGMEDIGTYGRNLKWARFGFLGETDEGIIRFANHCLNLKRLEICDCIFSESAIASAVLKLESLTYVCIKGVRFPERGRIFRSLMQDCWAVDMRDVPEELPASYVAYRCLQRKGTDASAISSN